MPDAKQTLVDYLQEAREAMVWKLEGLSEYDVRRPLTPTGSNLLGLVKHLASVELEYFGETFGRPHDIELPWDDDEEDSHIDLYATADETRDYIVGFYRQAWAHAAGTIEALDLDAVGRVPWWQGERGNVTLHQILVHMVAETCRHAGHADILREGLDGSAGRYAGDRNILDDYDYPAHHEQVEEIARRFR